MLPVHILQRKLFCLSIMKNIASNFIFRRLTIPISRHKKLRKSVSFLFGHYEMTDQEIIEKFFQSVSNCNLVFDAHRHNTADNLSESLRIFPKITMNNLFRKEKISIVFQNFCTKITMNHFLVVAFKNTIHIYMRKNKHSTYIIYYVCVHMCMRVKNPKDVFAFLYKIIL